MLQLELSLVENELNHYAGDKGQSNSCHEDKVIGTRSCLKILELLIDGVRFCRDAEFEFWVASGNTKNGLVHVLGIQGGHILRSHVQEADNLIEIFRFVCMVNLVRAISIGIKGQFIARLIHHVVEFSVVQVVDECDLESLSCIGQSGGELTSCNLVFRD